MSIKKEQRGRQPVKVQIKDSREKITERVLRLHSGIMCVYFLLLLLSLFTVSGFFVFWFGVLWLFIHILSFYKGLKIKTESWLRVNYCLNIFFAACFVVLFGWECGAQNFLFVTLALLFLAGEGSTRRKSIQTVFLCLLYILLYGYTQSCRYPFEIQPFLKAGIQVANVIAVFMLLVSCFSAYMENKKEIEERMHAMAGRLKRYGEEDPLTGISNRKSMMEYLEELAGREAGEDAGKICVAVGDVDCFGKINDRFGHDCGDIIIKQLAYQFQKYMEDKGRVARWGGEEFLFIFDHASGEDAYYYLMMLQQQIRSMEFTWKDEFIKLTMTYGLMEYDSEKSIDYCIVEADKKMFMGKESGKNTIIY